jgi:hypothetical protein
MNPYKYPVKKRQSRIRRKHDGVKRTKEQTRRKYPGIDIRKRLSYRIVTEKRINPGVLAQKEYYTWRGKL